MRYNIAITIFLFLTISVNAQQSKSEFHYTVDSINGILKANPLAYYTDNKQNSAFIKQISMNELGIVIFRDSIPKPEITTTTHKKPKLIPDCCHNKTIRTLDLFAVKNWDILFPYAYLKDKNNQIYGRIIGIQKQDLFNLKEQFVKLATLRRKEETGTKF